MKRIIAAVIAVFVLWTVLDFVVHVVLLTGLYEATADMWRPPEEAKRVLSSVAVLVFAFAFVYIYAQYIEPRSIAIGFQYGLLLGIGVGVSMGFGMYAYMPIPYEMALAWCLGRVVEFATAGLIVGWIFPKPTS